MIQRILVLAIIPCLINATTEILSVESDIYEDDKIPKRRTFVKTTDIEFEPVNPHPIDKDHMTVAMKNLNCEDFTPYTLNCTLEAALVYNSNRKTAPMPAKINDWCKAIRYLTNCAIDWNSECREVTESHFNEESIKGHMHVIDNICDDDWFLSRYDEIPMCIEATADVWEACYSTFKLLVDEQKNKTREWTHYETHFYMCCAKAGFRRCTLDAVFGTETCTQDHAATLHKFSVIISEGDVFQDCDANIMYANCPGGDPRPSKQHLNKLMSIESNRSSDVIRRRSSVAVALALFYISIFMAFKRF